jgi:2-polyprenyl-3-methyl-5-hydroxy-6-metoxy-1,4-benzoquinol methylase
MTTSFDSVEERAFLNSLVGDYKDQAPYSKIKKEIIFDLVKRFMENSTAKKGLQMGCSNGYETNILAKHLLQLDVVDGSTLFLEKTQNDNLFDNVNFVNALFEEYVLNDRQEKYDYVFCNYVLEHVFDVGSILGNIKNNLKPGGLLFSIVPNRNALSRQIALKMKLILNLDGLTENDLRHGHRRTFDVESISTEINNQGFEIIERRGIVLKILADFQLNKMLHNQLLSRDHIIALNELGEFHENMCDSIFIVAKTK